MQHRLNSAVYDVKRSAIRIYSQMAKDTPGCISLTLGEPDFDTPRPIINEAIDSLKGSQTHYIANNGDPQLLRAISEYEKKVNAVDYSPNEIIVTCGATEAIFAALFGITNPGDEIIVLEPAFGLYEAVVTLCRGKYVPIDTSPAGFQVDEQMLKDVVSEKTKAIIINSPNNPTGCVLSKQSLKNIYNAVCGKDIFVLCDDVYRQLIYTDEYSSFCEFTDLKEQIIVIQSFSKPYAMTGWRMGYLMAEHSVKSEIEKVHQYTVVSTASFSQRACIRALTEPVDKMLDVYRRRREYVLKRLDGIGLSYSVPMGAFYVFPSIERFSMSSDEFCRQLLKRERLAVTPGLCFGSDKHIRLTYCYADEQLKAGLDRLEKFVKGLEYGS